VIIEGLGMFLCHGVSAKIFERFLQHVLLFILNLIKREGTDLTELIGAHIWKHANSYCTPMDVVKIVWSYLFQILEIIMHHDCFTKFLTWHQHSL
jgi:hypothetical protein